MAVRDTDEVIVEVWGMLGLRLPDGLADATAIASALGAAIDADRTRDSEATHELVALLSSDRTTHGFVNDLAEILLLPRGERSEYVNNRLVSPPWVISKLLLEYATLSWRLDDLTGELTKGYCAGACERLPVGCCSVLGYDLGLVPDVMLVAQEVEARRNGWQKPERETKCRYHGDVGCVLRLFKSPACTGTICDALVDHLARRDRVGVFPAFHQALTRFRNADIDRAEIFAAMNATLAAGAELLAAIAPADGSGTI